MTKILIDRAVVEQAMEAMMDAIVDAEEWLKTSKVRKALRAALAEPAEREPAAWDDAQRICDLPAVDDAIRALIENQTNDNAVCVVQAILAEAPQPVKREPVAQGWQPIESAPKDGSMLLVCLPRQMHLVVRARYNRIHNFWQTDYEGEGGVTRPSWFHEGDLWHPIPPINDITKE